MLGVFSHSSSLSLSSAFDTDLGRSATAAYLVRSTLFVKAHFGAGARLVSRTTNTVVETLRGARKASSAANTLLLSIEIIFRRVIMSLHL